MKQSLRIGVAALWALGLPALAADLWTFDPPRMGRVLQGGDGAWVVDYTLGSLSAGAEFSFPPFQILTRSVRTTLRMPRT